MALILALWVVNLLRAKRLFNRGPIKLPENIHIYTMDTNSRKILYLFIFNLY